MKLESICSLCGRVKQLSFHHLIPRTCHSNKWFNNNFSKEEMKKRGIYVCHDCHKFIHSQFSEKELGRTYNTKESLLKNIKIKNFVNWVKKQK
jgi:5-methylcytosine-specific restriction endonuclease McrA